MSPFDQSAYGVRFEWGEQAVRVLAASTDVLVIVDVLSFSTAVDVAVGKGASVLPWPWRDPAAAAAFAEREHALLAVPRDRVTAGQPYSLSPATLEQLTPGTRLVLPSPNGSTLSRLGSAHTATVFAGCLRNASAVASAARRAGNTIAVIAAGERWPDNSLRPAIEDLVGAGAIIAALDARAWSPEAELAANAFGHVKDDLQRRLEMCASGRELVELGFGDDVRLAARLDVSETAPVFVDGAFRPYG